MLRTKKDVDKHVQELLKKVNNENERKGLGYNFAKLYSQVAEYKLARQYLAGFLSIKESSAPGHRLAGQISEAQSDKEAAVRSYKRSYDLDPSQKDLVFKICSLICEFPPSPATRDLQQVWLERAEALQPHHSVVFELKQRLLLSCKDEPRKSEQLEDSLKSEVMTKPSDMNLRVHLLRLYLDSDRATEAYEHVIKIEALQVFQSEPTWYDCVLDVLEAYRKTNPASPEFHLQTLNALDRRSYLKLAGFRGSTKSTQHIIGEVTSVLSRLDEALRAASESGSVAIDVLQYFACQLYFQMGMVILQKAQAGHEDQQEALGYAVALFALAYNRTNIMVPSKSSATDKKLLESLNSSASFRRSQCGHCVVAWETREGRKWVIDTVKRYDTVEGKRKLFDVVFGGQNKQRAPFFSETSDLIKVTSEVPSFSDLQETDCHAVQVHRNDLHHVVWLGLRYLMMHRRLNEWEFAADFSQILSQCRFVHDIPFASSSWNSSAPETLAALDIEAFIYAAIYCHVSYMDESAQESKSILPAALTRATCSEQQAAWWSAALKLITGSAKENLGEMRRVLQRGLEVIRLSGNNHGVPLELVSKLARTFASRAAKARPFPTVEVPAPIDTNVLSVEQTEALAVQAGRYWKAFLDMSNSGNRFTPSVSGRLFDFRSVDLDVDVLSSEARLYTGYHAWRSGRKEDAQRLLQATSDPYSSYYQALIFKESAEEEQRLGTFESRSASNVLLNRCRDALYLTLDRLRSPGMDRFHPLDQKLSQLIEKIETKLSTANGNGHSEPEAEDHDEDDDRSELLFVTPEQHQGSSTPYRRSFHLHGASVPRGSRDKSIRMEARPSPERLDAQLRQMVHRQEEFNQAISSELKQIRAEVVDIKSLIQKLEVHLEIQAREQQQQLQEVKNRTKKVAEAAAAAAVVSNYADEYGYDEEEDGDWEEEEDAEAEESEALSSVRNGGRIPKNAAPLQLAPASMQPLYAPPFAAAPAARQPTAAAPPYGAFMQPFAAGYGPQYPPYAGGYGIPYPGMGPAGFPYSPTLGHPMAHPWDMTGMGHKPPEMMASVSVPAPIPAPVPAPAAFPTTQSSVFSRLSVGNTPLLNSSLLNSSLAQQDQQQVVPHSFQISMPSQTVPAAVAKIPDKVIDTSLTAPIPLTTQGLLASIPEPKYSSVTTPEKAAIAAPATRDRKASSCSEGSNAEEEERDAYPDFKPIIPLPEEVPVHTGEEDEIVLFNQRSRLFRLVDSEWKERGVGEMKLLHDPSTNKVRLLMRRDQVLKVCANHQITADLKLTEKKEAANTLLWAALDFTDGEGRTEKFCAKFKTAEIVAEFKKAIEQAKGIVANQKTPEPAKAAPAAGKGFGDQFKPKSGSWICDICYIGNEANVTICPACETSRPGAEAAVPSPAAAVSATPSFQVKFGVPATTPAGTNGGFKFGTPTTTPAGTGEGFKFGTPATATPTTSAAPLAGFKFTTPPKTSAPAAAPAVTSAAPSEGFKFGTSTTTTAAPFATPTAPATTSGIVFGMITPPKSTLTSTTAVATPVKFGAVSTAAEVKPAAPVTSASFTFDLGKPTFSFAMPASSAPTTTTTATTKAPFTFSPPKLATPTAAVKTNGIDSAKTTPAAATTFGGFSFISTPVIVKEPEVKPAAETVKEAPKPSPFSGFSFGAFGTKDTKDATPAASAIPAGSDKKQDSMLFSLLANQVSNKQGFSIEPNKEFPGAGSKLFSAVSESAKKEEADGEDGEDGKGAEEYEPDVAFAPVIPLPALVDVTTGEEEENVLFSERAFLYRFVADTKEWKEKGRGEMKILEHKTTGRARLLMRREQVLKVCCNHVITAALALKPLQTSDRTWTWSAQDFSEGELSQETFALKFKTSEQAQKFKKIFEEAQTKEKPKDEAAKPETKTTETKTSETKALFDKFKPKEGSWECGGCFVRNPAEVTKCPACETLKPGTTAPASAGPTLTSSGFKFGTEPAKTETKTDSKPSIFDKFKPKEGSWECPGCCVRNNAEVAKCPACETLKPGTTAPAATVPVTSAPSTGFKFGTGGFSFGTPAAPAAGTTPAFGGFNFSMAIPKAEATSPGRNRVKSGRSPNVSVSSDNEVYEGDEGDHIHFEPIIPLPEKVEVKTGEEDEEATFCHRAKLLRLTDGEWKERGVGDVKLLKHKTTGKFRLLMRREQVFKICLNHALTTDLIFKSKDERSWLWAARDFSEGEGVMETLVIRFRGPQEAQNFMDAIDKAKQELGTTPASPSAPSSAPDESVQVVFEKKATPAQLKLAADLKLPPNFFLYESAPPCPGCRGCTDDLEIPASAPVKTDAAAPEPTPKPEETEPKAATTTPSMNSWKLTTPSGADLSFSSLATTSGSVGFNKSANFSWSGTGQRLFESSPANKEEDGEEGGENGEDDGTNDTCDAHFEPVVPLPALVEVKTGEEGEEVVFSHRAKLYRFDSSTKEWKERGVGDIKILHNQEKKTYRILLRRDQIHKLACNHLLTSEMVLNPMSTSNNAWTWFAMDFSQGEMLPEQFAVRFKTDEPATAFKNKFVECQAALERPVTTVDAPAVEEVNAPEPASAPEAEESAAAEEEGEEEEYGEEGDEEEYEDMEETVMFEKRCTLSSLEEPTVWCLQGTGSLKIIYDDDMLCARIVFEADGPTTRCLCDNVIAIETKLEIEGKEGVWSAIDYSSDNPVSRTFRAQFSSNHAALEFQAVFNEAKQYAEKSDVHDEPDTTQFAQGGEIQFNAGKFSFAH